MSAIWIKWSEKLGRVSFLTMGVALACWANSAIAQITPDNTMGRENSRVTSSGEVDTIDGGATRGTNLFHSFREFNVDEGRAAVFTNPSGIENILTRVTGANPSNILGTLGVAGGSANLFLINPNGIIFGPNARLDIGGSFVATTANAISFGEQGVFSATNPSNSELLTVNPSAFLFNQIRAAAIQNNSVADSGLNPSSEFTARGLRVLDGKGLLLVGGDINMNGGRLYAFGGRVELGSLAGVGTIGLNGGGDNLSLSFPDSVERGDVSLSNGAIANVTAGDGGSIAVNARSLEMTGGSGLSAGIASGLGDAVNQAGNIEVNATEAVNLNNKSVISNQVRPEAKGQGGDVSISASTLQLEGGAQVFTGTFGAGKGGSLTVNASAVQLIGRSADDQFASALGASAQRNSTGDAGNLTLNTHTLLVRDGAQVNSAIFGAGNGGNLTVNATNVQIIGTSIDSRVASSLGTDAQRNSTGDAGNLTLNTHTLLVRDGAQVVTATFGAGKGGNLTVNASEVQIIGESANGRVASALDTSAQPNSTGDAGDLTLNAHTLLVRDGAQVGAGTFGAGKGGNLRVNATNTQVIGESADNQTASSLFSSAQRNSTGNAGDLTINTHTLLVQDGAVVSSGTRGAGKGGNLTVNATNNVQLIGTSADGQFPSGLSTGTLPNSTGNAGDLTINTHTLLVRDGALAGTGTFGAGKGGNLRVNATNTQVIGRSADNQFASGLFASTQPNSTGDAGDLTINTDTLLAQDGAIVSVQSFGTGTAGNMTLNARSIHLNNNASLSASTQRSTFVNPNSEQVTININSQNLFMSRNSSIFTNARGENVIGGNINIDTDFLIAVDNSDISANSANFRGGNVRINAFGVFGTQFRAVPSDRTSDITATGSSPQLSGTVELNTPEFDPNSGLVNLPSVPVDTQVAQACTPSGTQAQSEFIVTGRGGLPPNPTQVLSSDAISVDWVALQPTIEDQSSPTAATNSTAPSPAPMVEAQGWLIGHKGEIILTASTVPVQLHNSWQSSAQCKLP